MGPLDGKVAVVTGAAQGIGRAIADGLAAAGATAGLAAELACAGVGVLAFAVAAADEVGGGTGSFVVPAAAITELPAERLRAIKNVANTFINFS